MEREGTRAGRIRQASASRRAQQKLDLRQSILDAALALFADEGYEGFSLRQVAEKIGYSPTAIYQHFADKDELLYHVALEGYRVFGERLQAGYDAERTAPARLRAIGRAYVGFGLSHPVHYRLMFMQRGDFFHRPRPQGHEHVVDSFGVLRRAVREGLDAGELKPAAEDDLTTLLWSAVHGLVSLALGTKFFEDVDVEALYERHLEVMLRDLAA